MQDLLGRQASGQALFELVEKWKVRLHSTEEQSVVVSVGFTINIRREAAVVDLTLAGPQPGFTTSLGAFEDR